MSTIAKTEKPYRGLDVDRMVYYCGKNEWKVNPKGHTKTIHDQLLAAVKEYEDVLVKVNKGETLEAERSAAHDKASKTILATGLENFDFEKESDSEEVGVGACHKIADDIYRFLAVIGGKAEYQHWLMQLNLATQNFSNGTKD